MNINIQAITDELHKAYGLLNETFFDGKLPGVALTIQSKGKRNALGWFTFGKVWRDADNKIEMHEINLSAEFVSRPFLEIMQTLLHEQVHLYCAVNGIKETSRNGVYHNKKFKEEAEAHGLHHPEDKPDETHGWTFVKLTEESEKKIAEMPLNKDLFQIARLGMSEGGGKGGGKKKGNSTKWQCPVCETKLRSTKKLENPPVCSQCSVFGDEDIIYFEEVE